MRGILSLALSGSLVMAQAPLALAQAVIGRVGEPGAVALPMPVAPRVGASLVPSLAPQLVLRPALVPVQAVSVKAKPVALAVPVQQAMAELPPEKLAALSPEDASGAVGRILEGASPQVPADLVAPRSLNIRYRIAKALARPILAVLYRVTPRGLENLPRQGPGLLVPNHVSFVDVLLLSLKAGRPIRFLMYRKIYDYPMSKWFFKAFGAIPIAAGDSKEALARAFDTAKAALKAGELVAIFPEGKLTGTGNMGEFKRGFERISKDVAAPIIPVHIDGLWGSVFSRRPGETFLEKLMDIPRPVILRFGKALSRGDAQEAREEVQRLGAESMEERVRSRAKTLPLAFLSTAKKSWSRRAVADSTGKSLTFGKTLTATVLLAGLLSPRLTPAGNVGVLLPSSVGGVLANTALGVLGKVPVNLNYTASREAMDFAIQKAGVKSVITSRKFLQVLQEKTGQKLELGADVLYLEDMLPLIPAWKQALTYILLRILPQTMIDEIFYKKASRNLDDDAAILFTSGTSAMPKGVELTHANIQSNLEMVREVFAFDKNDGVLGALPFFHSFGLTVTLWLPLIAGFSAAYHTHPLETDAIAALAAKYKPTFLFGTPTFLLRYAQKIASDVFSSIRLVVAGAERLRPEVSEAFEKKFGVKILEGYGATELSPIATVNVPDAPKQVGAKPGSVGQPLPGVAARVVDPDTGAPLPLGTPGMLLIKGGNVMKGYLGEPQKTAEVIKDGWYVTGDIASVDRDGFVTLVGRLSRFSKLAGEMVSHTAVEEKLQLAAGVDEQIFVVTAVADEKRGERLVVLHTFDGPVLALLDKARALGLPKLWTPGRDSFYKVEKIPLLGSGKLDLKAVNELAKALAVDQKK